MAAVGFQEPGDRGIMHVGYPVEQGGMSTSACIDDLRHPLASQQGASQAEMIEIRSPRPCESGGSKPKAETHER